MIHFTTYQQNFPCSANGGFQNYGFRMYDTRVARFWGVDPLTKDRN